MCENPVPPMKSISIPELAILAVASLLLACAHAAGRDDPGAIQRAVNDAVRPGMEKSPASQLTVDAHVGRATATAGDDLKHLLRLRQPQPGQRPSQAAVDQLLERAIALPPPDHGQVFDNLYFVGSSFISAWVLKTSDDGRVNRVSRARCDQGRQAGRLRSNRW
jgi:hypothetical protein